jgi:choline kinase
MNAIILAAGKGTRLNKYTEKLPKGMLEFCGMTLIERQITTMRKAGIEQIAIVTGYQAEKISFEDVQYFHNDAYATTNMVESLLCAQSILNQDTIVAYSDIIYSEELLNNVIQTPGDIVVAVDENWREYWQKRYGTTEFDLESLEISNNHITSLGVEVESSGSIDYRYVGLIKFSAQGLSRALEIYQQKEKEQSAWKQSGKTFKQGYMTDLLDELIRSGQKVTPAPFRNHWLEFDTNEDYERMIELYDRKDLEGLIPLR